MSAEELSKLTLGDTMVTTRAGAARARTAPPLTSQESPSSSPAASPTPSLIETTDGHRYDVSTFSDDLRRRAKRGLMGDNAISMKFCKEIETDPERYVFHLDDDITVAMDSEHAPKCSCGANEGGRACKHIFWMLGQLTSTVRDAQPFQLAEDGSSVRDKHPADIIKRFSLEKIADSLDWILQEDQLPEDEEMIDEIANMLSVFEPTEALPIEFKDEETPDLSEQSRKYREFKDLIVQHATRNTALFIQLQEIFPLAFQVQVFFDKINHRIDRAFNALREYIDRGPTNTLSEALDVENCAVRLRALVIAVNEYYVEQVGEGSDDNNVAVRAAAALVKILDGVTERDFDVYRQITWDALPPNDPRKSNLFRCLIEPAGDIENQFVLDVLLNLPQDALRDHFENLYNIDDRLRSTPWTPPAYMDSFRTLFQDNRKRAASDSGGSSAKRPMQ